MSKTNPENMAEARAAGVAAAERGANCVPAHCQTYRDLITGFKIGEGAARLAAAWIEGYRSEINKTGETA
jgi:hypothetical protein